MTAERAVRASGPPGRVNGIQRDSRVMRTGSLFLPATEAERRCANHGINSPLVRIDRDGREHLVGGLSETDSLARLLRDFALMLGIVGATLALIGWLANGFAPPAPKCLDGCEETDAIRGSE